VAYEAPAIRVARTMPSFATGYATGANSEAGAHLWSRCALAFAPFLGPVPNPTKLLFGRGLRPGNTSFSGGRPAQSVHGWAWEFTNITDFINCGKDGDVLGTTTAASVVIGMRKTDNTDRDSNWIGVDLTLFDSGAFWLRRIISGPGNVQHNWKGALASFTPGGSFTSRTDHVWALGITNQGGVSNLAKPILVDGQERTFAASGNAISRVVKNANVLIGNSVNLGTADLMVIDFLYLFIEPITRTELARLSVDPGIMFRPLPSAVSFRLADPLPPPAVRSDLQLDTGGDIDIVTDLAGPYMRIATGLRNIGNALARRLTTPRGGLFYDPDYGLDVRDYLSAGMTPQQLSAIQGDITNEVSKDERIDNPVVTVVQNLAAATMRITIACDLATGPFTFIVGVSQLTVELLDVQAAS
jgi:hypothetical protein